MSMELHEKSKPHKVVFVKPQTNEATITAMIRITILPWLHNSCNVRTKWKRSLTYISSLSAFATRNITTLYQCFQGIYLKRQHESIRLYNKAMRLIRNNNCYCCEDTYPTVKNGYKTSAVKQIFTLNTTKEAHKTPWQVIHESSYGQELWGGEI